MAHKFSAENTNDPGTVTCEKVTKQMCVSHGCESWRNATCVAGECVCGAGLCSNDIGACVPYEGEPGVLANYPCMTTEDDFELFKVKEVEGDYDVCIVMTPRSFVRFDY